MPRLIHLNGPSGVGKSTVARRYVEDHPGSLNVDADVVVSLIGGWEKDFFATLTPARNLAVAMATAHLREGHDVVLPQLITSLDEAGEFEDAAEVGNAAYLEVAMFASVEEQIERFRAKSGADPVHRQVARTIDASGGDALLRKIDQDFRACLAHRSSALKIDTSGTEADAAFGRLLTLLSR